MSREEATAILTRHLALCDAAGRGNDHGANAWRDVAAAIRLALKEMGR